MIRKCLAKYIQDNVTELSDVILSHNDLILSTIRKPFATVSYVTGSQPLWEIGDIKRQNDIKMQLSLYASTFDEQMNLKNKITRVIETAMTDISTTGTPQMEPGIALMGLFDKLRTTDYKTYFSDQNNWLASPSPVIYRNGAVISTGFTIDRPNGKIVFGSAQPTTDDIRADYKVGYLDFIISSINDLPITDIANVTHKFNSFFTLDTFIYVRTKGQKLL